MKKKSEKKPYLAIDTSTELGSIAVGRGDRLLAEIVVGVRVRHSEALLPAIDFALRAAGVETAELGGIVVGAGPGSFTGVRIAAATAKGMVRVLGTPLFAYSGLLALAAGVGAGMGSAPARPADASVGEDPETGPGDVVPPAPGPGERPVCALFDARRGEVYAGCYRFGGGRIETILEPQVQPLAGVLEELRGFDPVYAGDGAERYHDQIADAGGRLAPAIYSVPRGSADLWLAETSPEAGSIADPAEWEPEYLRAAGAQRMVRG
jgi:tRNA threonylcarbamoyladenosine biosynthesis protein TsaB